MKREDRLLKKDIILRRAFIKSEIKLKIIKSIFQNRTLENTKRLYILMIISRFKITSRISLQKNKCLISSNSKGVYKKFLINRHVIKRFNNLGVIQNVTTKKW